MFITDDGVRLNARLELPAEHIDRCPLVIVIHGFTGHMEERHILAVSQAIREAGCATLRVDMYGHGHSDGEFSRHTLFKWLSNALTVIDYARSLEFVTELFLCGHSQGGLTVMLAGAMKHESISGLIPLSPAWMIPAEAREGILLGERFDPASPRRLRHGDSAEIMSGWRRPSAWSRPSTAIRAPCSSSTGPGMRPCRWSMPSGRRSGIGAASLC